MKKPHHIAEPQGLKPLEGGRGFQILPRGLNIVWGEDSRYWDLPTSMDDPATLIQVSWLDVSGSVDVHPGRYRISFDVGLKPDAFGWSGSPVLVMAKVGKKGRYQHQDVHLNSPFFGRIPAEGVEITVPPDPIIPDKKLYFGLYEVWSGKWKGGLVVKKAYVERMN